MRRGFGPMGSDVNFYFFITFLALFIFEGRHSMPEPELLSSVNETQFL